MIKRVKLFMRICKMTIRENEKSKQISASQILHFRSSVTALSRHVVVRIPFFISLPDEGFH
jgi:hypothetical protein